MTPASPRERQGVKERPIIMSAPMVRALLDGRKTQTRRIIKPQPANLTPEMERNLPEAWATGFIGVRCPYGAPGDSLWVRETWSHTGEGVWSIADARRLRGFGRPIYAATHDGPKPLGWWPSIHMPREFSRITLEITEVRVERLQEISEEDAIAEGVVNRGRMDGEPWDHFHVPGFPIHEHEATTCFSLLWEAINGDGSWDANPWVWVLGFHILANQPSGDPHDH